MIRQFELVERVQSYDPDADEDVLNRAYVYRLKAHGTQLRASGDPYFSHPGRGRRHPDRDEARHRLDRHRPAARHGRGHRRHAATRSSGCSARRSPRLVDGVTKLSRLELQSEQHQAGGELPQAGAGDVGRHPRAAGQARRPPAQHAHAALHQGAGAAPAHRARDDGDLRAARRAHRHGEGEARARGAGLRRAQSRRPRHRSRPASGFLREQGERHRPADRGRADRDA